LRKFHDFQRQEEARAIANEQFAATESVKGRQMKYEAIHAHQRHRAAMDRDHQDQLEVQWELNQEAKLERERSQLRYELALQERKKIHIMIKHKELALEASKSTEEFELNLRRLGIGDADSNSDDLATTTNETVACIYVYNKCVHYACVKR
jgi:hypothetical protein